VPKILISGSPGVAAVGVGVGVGVGVVDESPEPFASQIPIRPMTATTTVAAAPMAATWICSDRERLGGGSVSVTPI
jgi:hypothetical protein